MVKQSDNRLQYRDNTAPSSFYPPSTLFYPAYRGPSGLYPGGLPKREGRGWIFAGVLLCLAILAAGVAGGLYLRQDPSAPLGTEQNPAGVGQTFLIDSEEQVGATDQMARCKSKITLTQAIRGDAAAKIVDGLGGAKPPLAPGEEYYVARFCIELLESSASGRVRYSSIYFDAKDQNNEKYLEWMDDISGNFPALPAGGKSDGIIVFVVQKGDRPVILYKAAENRFYYFYPNI